MAKFVSELRQVGGFLQVLRFTSRITDRHDITEILLKVALNTINLTLSVVILYTKKEKMMYNGIFTKKGKIS